MSSDPNSHGQNGDRQPAAAWEELLSAYVDGEVNDVERGLIERRCAQDPAARQMRDEWLALSEAIKALPRPTAPAGLVTAVVESARQSGLVTTAPPAIDLPVKKRPMLRRREWLAGFTALLASLFVVVTLPWEQESGDKLVLMTQREGEREESIAAVAFDTRMAGNVPRQDRLNETSPVSETSLAASGAAEEPFFNSGMTPAPVSPTPKSAAPPATPKLRQATELGVMRRKGTGQDLAGNGSQGEGGDRTGNDALSIAGASARAAEAAVVPAEGLDAWQDVQPYLNLMTQNTSAVANFDLVVLDVEKSADQFQVLLVQNGVLKVADDPALARGAVPAKEGNAVGDQLSEKSGATTDRFQVRPEAAPVETADKQAMQKDQQSASFGRSGDDPLVAVYVEAEEASITKALQEMVRQRQVVAMRLQPPLQFDEATQVAAKSTHPPAMNLNFSDTDLQDAYLGLQFGTTARTDVAAGTPVSAVEESRNTAETPGQAPGVASTARPARSMAAGNTGAGNTGVGGLAGSATSPAARNLSPVAGQSPDSPEADFQAVAPLNFNRRLNLPQTDANWLREVQDEQRGAATKADRAFQRQLTVAGDGMANSLRSMRRDFKAAAPQTVRVLFVLQPASATPAGSGGAAATEPAGPGSAPAMSVPAAEAPPKN